MTSIRTLSAAPLLCLLAGCGAASSSSGNTSGNAATAQDVTQTAVSTTTSGAANLGVDVGYLDYWAGSRPFMNLIYGTNWGMQASPTSPGEDVPAADLDANGWVKAVPAGYNVIRGLSVPAAGGDIICRYQGSGNFSVSGPVSNITTGAGFIRFTIAPTYPKAQWTVLKYTFDPTNYVKNLDCREASASTTDEFAPEYLALLKGMNTVRFMKWGYSEANPSSITWATRNVGGGGTYQGNDGVPVEAMVDLANTAGVDPWFSIPWNADNDYITQFATYVRDHLAPGRKAYVEVSNEVWNWGYPVTAQAKNEAIAEGLVSAEDPTKIGGNGERYAEKTKQVMAIWSNVFSGQTSRIVRVFAWQHVQPYWSDKLLAYMNTYQSVDALATAPYWGDESSFTGMTADQIFAQLSTDVTNAVNNGVQQKAVAAKYGIRYVTYEGGQSLVMPSNLTLLDQMEHDTRMHDLYKTFISSWQSQVGDLLTLFCLTGSTQNSGSWGLVDYGGQPYTQTPKMQAVQEFLGLSTTTATSTGSTTTTTSTGGTTTTTTTGGTTTTTTSGGSTPIVSSPTQICPNGTIISVTSTCPTSGSNKKTGTTTKGGGKTATA